MGFAAADQKATRKGLQKLAQLFETLEGSVSRVKRQG
jgi:hypothetical protein